MIVKHLITYAIGGVLTTAVNFVIYFSLCAAGMGYLTANTAAWAAAVIFSYFINRRFVFHSDGKRLSELLSFCSLRLLTLLAEDILLFLSISVLLLPSGISKLFVSIVTVLVNYLICRKKIFVKGVHTL